MKKSRVLFLSAVSFLLILGPLFSIGLDEEYWPFSKYSMFSDVRGGEDSGSAEGLELYGVTREEPHHEVPMSAHPGYVEPFDQVRFRSALRRIENKRNPERRSRLLNEALLDSLKRYEEARLTGLHDGPPLQGLRLYRVERQDDGQAENADRPNHWELIAEVEQGQEGG